jgi:hypothetical protein
MRQVKLGMEMNEEELECEERLNLFKEIAQFILDHPHIEHLDITIVPDGNVSKVQLNLKVFEGQKK